MNRVKAHQKLPSNWNQREKLRDKGQFWTPTWVAEAMIAYVAEDTELIFDPATGRGAFLDALKKLHKSKISFFGTDIDPAVLQDEIYNDDSCFTELRDFIKDPPKRTFKAIVANPPYIRHHRLDEETKMLVKKLCINITGFAIDGRAGYHIYFLLQALNQLEANGKLAFIMPADTCEGVFAKKLWDWIARKFCIECVVAFDRSATPFPNVDTNPLIFLIKNAKPQKNIFWVKAKDAYSDDLLKFISSRFKKRKLGTIEITNRILKEALQTGLSRPEQNHDEFQYHLNDFAKVIRGIATGDNEFFFLTHKKVKELGIPLDYLKAAVGRTRDAVNNVITKEDIRALEKNNRPTLLFSINGHAKFPENVSNYLKLGEKAGLPNHALIKQRNPWYKMEQRDTPPILFAYLGRRNARFIKNEAGVVPLTGFLCVYPIYTDTEYVDNLWQALNHPDTLKNLQLVGKSYGSGAIKVEPRSLNKLPIPEHIVKQYHLKRLYVTPSGQFDLFRDPKKRYKPRS